MSRTDKPIETESGFVAVRGWEGEWGETANEDGVSFWGDGDVLELDRGGG